MSRGRLLLTALVLVVGAAGTWAVTGGGDSDGGASSRAQAASASTARLPTYGSLGRSHTVVVRELPAALDAAVVREEPAVLPRRAASLGVRVGDGSASRSPAANALAGFTRLGAQTAAPNILTSFEGLGSADNPFGLTPPDPQIAVGPDHVVSFVNITGRVFDKNGSTVSTFLLADFFGVPPGYRDTDPKVIYDALSGRWFAAYSSSIDNTLGDDEGLLHLAVSKTSDPTGLWHVYEVSYVDVLADYPGIGLTDDKFTISINVFDIDGGDVSPGCSLVSGYCGEQTIVVEKSHLLDGLPGEDVDATFFPRNMNRFTVRPAHSLSSVNDQYLTTWNVFALDQLTVIRITGTPAGGDVVETSVTNVVTLDQDNPPLSITAGSGDCAIFGDTLDPPPCIHSGDFRMLEAIWRDNSLWSAASAACMPPGDSTVRSCAHLVEVATEGQPSLVQDIMFGASGEYYSWPSIRTDSSGNLFVSLTHTSPSIFAEASVVGRLAGDPPNTMSASTVLRAGEIAHFSGRWGDYLGVAVDPTDPSSVWLIGQYAKDDGVAGWGTYIGCASFTTYGCGIATPTPTPTATPCPDNDGDTICDGADPDDDNDGCTDVAELQTAVGSEVTGGRRDPFDFWDFFDPNRDRAVSLGDFLAVLARFGSTGDPGIDPLSEPPPAPAYHTRYDRTGAPPGANPWQAGPPDGSIGLTDFLALLAQFGHTCSAPEPTPTALPSVTPTPTTTPTP